MYERRCEREQRGEHDSPNLLVLKSREEIWTSWIIFKQSMRVDLDGLSGCKDQDLSIELT